MSLFRSFVNPKTIVLGGLAVAAVAGALKNRDRVAGLIGARSSEPEPPRPDAGFTPAHESTPAPGQPAPAPAPSNYDLSGPAENTSTSLPAPEPSVRAEGGIDEAAEEAAAAAEAAAIGGATPEYAGLAPDESADDPFRPLAEAGEGEAEGQELAEADLRDNVEPHAGDPSDAERRIQETMDIQGNPTRAEIVEPLPGQREGGRAEAEQAAAGAGDTTDWASPQGSATVSGGITSGGGVGTPDAPAFAAEPGSGGAGETAERAAGAASGLPDTAGVDAATGSNFAGGKTGDEPSGGAFGDVGASGGTGSPAGSGSALGETGAPGGTETPAEQKSAAVWSDQGSGAQGEDDDDNAEWQTWSGNAGRS